MHFGVDLRRGGIAVAITEYVRMSGTSGFVAAVVVKLESMFG